ncbi:MAG: M20 family metallo-hydrolase [Treponema sp.]|jgi:succinyl-diaminopimelate desuccinylase|nr:M20 family metallo-hydrolase [Treponema sp.]
MKDQLFKWIDNSIPLAIELETELTKRPAVSPESGGEGELDKCLFLEEWLKSHGITQLERYDAPDRNAKGGIRPNLIATISGSDETKERLWIMSHLDVVPPGDENLWTNDPWNVVYKEDPPGRRLIGRGVEDNQQGITASILAALSFTAQNFKPARTIKLLFVSDEEVGSAYGIEWLVKNHGDLFKKNDMVLVPDGGDPKAEFIEVSEKNILWVKFITKGKQAHGSKPDLGTNAFLAGSELALCLHYELSAEFYEYDSLFDPDYSTFQPTKKEANVPNINTIPGIDIFYMDMRVLPIYSTELILKEIDNIKATIEEKHGVTIEYNIIQRMESMPTSPSAKIVTSLDNAIKEVYAVSPKPVGIGGGTVAAYLRNIGIDCAVWTKTDQTLHQPNEYVLLDNILGDAKVMSLLAL